MPEYAIVIIGSAAGNTKDAVDLLREKGEKVGLLKLRVFRPFPGEEIAEALKNTKAVAVLDRAESFSGMGGPVGTETKAALMDAGVTSKVLNYFYGIGGRDYTEEEAIAVYEDLKRFAAGEEVEQYQYIGLRSREEK